MMDAKKVKQVREITGVATNDICRYWRMFPKATVNDMIEILQYVGLAVHHKVPAEEAFKHLK